MTHNNNINNNINIIEIANELIERMQHTNETNITKLAEKIVKTDNKYKQFQTRHFPIFHGILTKRVNKDNVHLLVAMLKERKKIQDNKIEPDDATQNIATLLSDEFKVDWSQI